MAARASTPSASQPRIDALAVATARVASFEVDSTTDPTMSRSRAGLRTSAPLEPTVWPLIKEVAATGADRATASVVLSNDGAYCRSMPRELRRSAKIGRAHV